MANSRMNRIVAKDGVIELNGQFYLQQQDRAQSEFQHLTGEKTISQEAIRRFQNNVDLSAAYCKAAGIPYLHVVYPTKAMAFRDDFAKVGVTLSPLFSEAHRHDEVIYPLDDLVGDVDFQKRGSHCSDPGYLKIAQIALRTVGVPIDPFKPKYSTHRKANDLAHMRGLPRQKQVRIRDFEGVTRKTRGFSNKSMIPGNSGTVKYYRNKAAPNRARILMFGDSFFADTLYILTPLFRELILVRCPYVMEDVANATEPDIILTGNAERYLVNVPDKMRDAPFFTNFFRPAVDASKLSERDRDALEALFSGRRSDHYRAWRAQSVGRGKPGAAPGTGPGSRKRAAKAAGDPFGIDRIRARLRRLRSRITRTRR